MWPIAISPSSKKSIKPNLSQRGEWPPCGETQVKYA